MSNSGVVAILISFLVLFLLILGYFLFRHIRRKKYSRFVLEHSSALKTLEKINRNYHFFKIPNFDEEHTYDNEDAYDGISCEDYLIYLLANNEKAIRKAMKDCLANKTNWETYKKEIEETCIKNQYDSVSLPRKKKYLEKIETKILNEHVLRPTISFSITIDLERVDMGENYKESKRETFDAKKISDLLSLIRQKRGNFYLVRDVWDAICRVERGKVSFHMRFAIFRRDGNRCKRCGSHRNLEIDHIVPVSKGGKSVYSNLQTLCHRCNVEKGTDIERY